MPKDEKIEIGSVYVDAGLIWVGDPCYVMGDDASNRVKDWHEFCDALYKNGQYDNRYSAPLGNGTGFAVESGYGDGAYPVFVDYNSEGRVKSLTVRFDWDEKDEDNDDY